MNKLPRDVICLIYKIVHQLNMNDLNKEFLAKRHVSDFTFYHFWVLGFQNKPYNMRGLSNLVCANCNQRNDVRDCVKSVVICILTTTYMLFCLKDMFIPVD